MAHFRHDGAPTTTRRPSLRVTPSPPRRGKVVRLCPGRHHTGHQGAQLRPCLLLRVRARARIRGRDRRRGKGRRRGRGRGRGRGRVKVRARVKVTVTIRVSLGLEGADMRPGHSESGLHV